MKIFFYTFICALIAAHANGLDTTNTYTCYLDIVTAINNKSLEILNKIQTDQDFKRQVEEKQGAGYEEFVKIVELLAKLHITNTINYKDRTLLEYINPNTKEEIPVDIFIQRAEAYNEHLQKIKPQVTWKHYSITIAALLLEAALIFSLYKKTPAFASALENIMWDDMVYVLKILSLTIISLSSSITAMHSVEYKPAYSMFSFLAGKGQPRKKLSLSKMSLLFIPSILALISLSPQKNSRIDSILTNAERKIFAESIGMWTLLMPLTIFLILSIERTYKDFKDSAFIEYLKKSMLILSDKNQQNNYQNNYNKFIAGTL